MDHKGYSPPPPAYSEEEFDRKINTTAQLSLHTPQPSLQRTDEEEWEEWDEAAFEAAFEAAARAMSISEQTAYSQPRTSGSVAHPSTVGPLRIQKKAASADDPQSTKPRPSWLPNAEASGSSSTSGSRGESGFSGVSGTAGAGSLNVSTFHSMHTHQPLDNDEDGFSHPPPPFAAVGPPLDGPPFEEVVTVAYRGNESRSPSPLASPTFQHSQPPSRPTVFQTEADIHARTYSYQQHQQGPMDSSPGLHATPHRPVRQSLPSPVHSPAYYTPQRPSTTFSPSNRRSPATAPRVNFNPSMAYQKPSGSAALPVQQEAQVYNATAFYNSAVSGHLVRTTPIRPYSSNLSDSHSMRSNYSSPQSGGYSQPPATNWDAGASTSSHDTEAWSPLPTYPTTPTRTTVPSATHFPQYPSYASPSTNTGNTQNRWATSEQQFTGYH